jgi:hypothetical protein
MVKIPEITPWSFPKRSPPRDANYCWSVRISSYRQSGPITNATPSRYVFWNSFPFFGTGSKGRDGLLCSSESGMIAAVERIEQKV